MKKEIPIIITILHGKSCGLSYSAIDVDTNATNVPQAVKDADVLTLVPTMVEYNKMVTVPSVVIHGYFEQDKTIKVKFVYNVDKELFDKITKYFVSNRPISGTKDSKITILLIKEVMDQDDPLIYLTKDEG